jgi:hypothetical protein
VRRDAIGIGDAFDPPRQSSTDGQQWTVPIYWSSINCALRSEVIRGRSYENIVTGKCDCRAIRCMKAFLLSSPCCSAVPADTEPTRSRRDDDVGTSRVGTDLVHVIVDIDRRLPRYAAVSGSRDAADVHVREQDRIVARCGY